MRIEFIPAVLEKPDDLRAELVVASIWQDERPLGGLAGLLDWHLLGGLQAWVKRGIVTGRRGETVLLPGKPHLAIEKIVLLGLGPVHGYEERELSDDLARIHDIVSGLGVTSPIIELPLRRAASITKARAGALLFERLAPRIEGQKWTFVEAAEDANVIRDELSRSELSARKV